MPWEGTGFKPVGYGVESVTAIIDTMRRIEDETVSLPENEALIRRREIIIEVNERGIIATPANSYYKELVNEAARMSILKDGMPVEIVYGDSPHVRAKY